MGGVVYLIKWLLSLWNLAVFLLFGISFALDVCLFFNRK